MRHCPNRRPLAPTLPILLLLLLGAALVPGAASSNDEDGSGLTDSGEAVLFGLVRLREPDDGGDDGDAYASFVRFDRALSNDELLAGFRPEADTCTVETDGDSDDDDDDPFPHATGRPFDFVSAGDDVAFTGPDGPFLTLALVERPGYAGYRPGSRPLPTPFPADLSVDIAGADFPGFDAVPVAGVDPLTVSVPSDDEGVAADTRFRWEAGAGDPGGARVEIELEFDDADDGDDIDVTCSALDDGAFALPEDVLERLPAGATAEIDMERVALTVRGRGDALLVVKREAAGGL